MEKASILASRIKDAAKTRGVSVASVLISCNLSKNTVTKISGGSDIQALNLARIADYLNCSVDYLLGRTDDPARTPAAPPLDEEAAELVEVFEQLDRSGRRQLLGRAYELQEAQQYKTASETKKPKEA